MSDFSKHSAFDTDFAVEGISNGDLSDKPGVSQDDLDMQRLGKTQQFKVRPHAPRLASSSASG